MAINSGNLAQLLEREKEDSQGNFLKIFDVTFNIFIPTYVHCACGGFLLERRLRSYYLLYICIFM